MVGPPRQPPLVGRQAELEALLLRLADAGRGAGGLALVAGEPGIGKTRLLTEFAARARRDGWSVLAGQAYDTAGMPTYLPFREALWSHLRNTPPDARTVQLGEDAAELARLLPELRAHLPHLAVPPPATPAEARYRLFEAVSDVLLRIARAPGRAGLLLCLDDLHWADGVTLLLLEHLGRRLAGAPLLVAVAYRDTEVAANPPLVHTLTQLLRLPDVAVQRLELTRLPAAAVAELLRGLSGREPPAALVDLLVAETEGNPFFVGEVYRYLAEAGRLADAAGAWPTDFPVADVDVPPTVRLVVEQRLSQLSPACRRVLAWAAVIGRDFTFSLLEAVSEGDALDAIEEAQRAGLVLDGPGGREARYRFAHELIRQTLLAGLARPRRQRLHRRVAQALAPTAAEPGDLAAGDRLSPVRGRRGGRGRGTVPDAGRRPGRGHRGRGRGPAALRERAPGHRGDGTGGRAAAPGERAARQAGPGVCQPGPLGQRAGRIRDGARGASGTGRAPRAELRPPLPEQFLKSLDDPRDQLHRHAGEAVALARAVARPMSSRPPSAGRPPPIRRRVTSVPRPRGSRVPSAQAEQASVAAPPFAFQYFSLLLYWTGRLEEATRRGGGHRTVSPTQRRRRPGERARVPGARARGPWSLCGGGAALPRGGAVGAAVRHRHVPGPGHRDVGRPAPGHLRLCGCRGVGRRGDRDLAPHVRLRAPAHQRDDRPPFPQRSPQRPGPGGGARAPRWKRG